MKKKLMKYLLPKHVSHQLFLILFLTALSGFSQQKYTVSWEKGKDDLYRHSAKFIVLDSNNKAVPDATIRLDDKVLGNTNEAGILITDKGNEALAKYTLVAENKEGKSNKYTYHVKHSEYPSLIFTTLGKDPRSSMAFTWQTNIDTDVTIIECVAANDVQSFSSPSTIRSEGKSYQYDFADTQGEKVKMRQARVHKATVTGLLPNTKYVYRVGNGTAWSEGSFTTAMEGFEPFSFLFIPDIQEYSRENYRVNFKEVINKAFSLYPNSRFMIQGGDAVEKGGNTREYEWFYEMGERYFKNSPIVPVLGNHEAIDVKNNEHFINYFNIPDNPTLSYGKGSAYSFNYGNVHFLTLDMTSFSQITKKEKELKNVLSWIEEELKQVTDNSWSIVLMHQSIFSPARNYQDERYFLAPLFQKYGVHLVLTGHDHIYMRTDPLIYNVRTNDGISAKEREFGTVYIVGGSSSRKMYEQKYAKPYQAVVMAKGDFKDKYPNTTYKPMVTQNFMAIEVEKEELHIKTISKEGETLDEVFIKNNKFKK